MIILTPRLLANYFSAVILLTLTCCFQNAQPIVRSKEDVFLAIEQNKIEIVQKYIAEKGNLEVTNAKGETPLLVATHLNAIPLAKLLIDAGANVNAQDKIQDSPFLFAGASGFTEIVKMCLKSGVDYKVYNRYGGTALIPACEKGHVKTVIELLKDKKLPVNRVNNLGWTALLEVMVMGKGGIEIQTQITRLLVDAGCDVNIPDKNGVTPLTHAINNGYEEIVEILEKAGAK